MADRLENWNRPYHLPEMSLMALQGEDPTMPEWRRDAFRAINGDAVFYPEDQQELAYIGGGKYINVKKIVQKVPLEVAG